MPNGETLGERAGRLLRGKIWPGLDKSLGPQPAPAAPAKPAPAASGQASPSYISLPGQPVKKIDVDSPQFGSPGTSKGPGGLPVVKVDDSIKTVK
jgi:hypothetical protein